MKGRVLIVVSCMLTAPPSSAKRVEVLAACPDDPETANAVRELITQLKTVGFEPTEIRDRRNRPCWRDIRKELRDLMTQAESAFERMELGNAQRLAQRAVAQFLGAQALMDEREIYLRARMLLAWIAVESRQPATANEQFGEALAVFPKFVPDPELYPPPICNAFAAFKKARRAKPASLTLSSTPPAATIIVDGEPRGESPVVLQDLGAGWHFVELQAPGFASSFVSIRLPATSPPQLSLRERWPTPSGQAPRLDVAVAVNGVTRVTVRRADGALVETLATDQGAGGMAALATPINQALQSLPTIEAAAAESDAWWKNPWIWTAAAVVVAGGTAAVLMATADDRATVTIHPPPQ